MSCSSFYRSLVRMFSVGVLASLLALPVSARQGKDEMAPAIKTALEAKDYRVEVTFMTPMKGRSRALTSSYYDFLLPALCGRGVQCSLWWWERLGVRRSY